MENSYLNMAHFYSRKAEHYTKHRRYDEAIESHRRVVSYLDEALKISPHSAVILESLQLQRKYHFKQADFLRHKKQQHERYMKALEYQRRRNPEYLAKQMEKIEKYNELQLAIYQNLGDTDALLEAMNKGRSGSVDGGSGSDRKSSSVDELISLNHSLHVLIHRMAQNIDDYAMENETLKEKLSLYDKDHDNPAAGGGADKTRRDRGVSLETGRDALEAIAYRSEELPALEPLELPTFDLPELENN